MCFSKNTQSLNGDEADISKGDWRPCYSTGFAGWAASAAFPEVFSAAGLALLDLACDLAADLPAGFFAPSLDVRASDLPDDAERRGRRASLRSPSRRRDRGRAVSS